MTNPTNCGTLVISLHLDGCNSGPSTLNNDAALARLDVLLGLLRDARMPATWASHQPALSDAVTEILAEPIGHEIALWEERNLAEQEPGFRRRRELASQLEKARGAGYTITTLVSSSAPQPQWLQALSCAGIQTIGTSAVQGRAGGEGRWWQRAFAWFGSSADEPPQPRLLRYAIWEVPAAMALDSAVSPRRIARALESAAVCGEVLHVTIDWQRIEQGRAGGLKRIEQLLQAAFELRNERRLAVRTLSAIAERLRQQSTGKPAQSILRRAA